MEALQGIRLAARTRPRIVEEFDDWLVVEKPALMQVHPSKPGDPNTLWHYLCDLLAFERVNGGGVSIINRLDRETSGLTLVAKTRAAARTLCQHMEGRRIEKNYTAIVFGWPMQERWEVDAPLLRQGLHHPSRIWLKQCVHPKGSSAQTRFQVLARMEESYPPRRRFAVVRATPETGRMHQIRVHLAASGHPLVGDKIYGFDESCYLEFIETSWTASLRERLLLERHALHAGELLLEETGQKWEAPLPADLAAFVANLNTCY
jgi:23S rRNA pseudouridine1911/1915/1917 synthase